MIAERDGRPELAVRLLRQALRRIAGTAAGGAAASAQTGWSRARGMQCSRELVAQAESRDFGELKRLVFAAIAAGSGRRRSRCAQSIEKVFSQDPTLQAVWQADPRAVRAHRARDRGTCSRTPRNIAAANAASRVASFYWHCPACHSWDSLRGVRDSQTALACEICPTARVSQIRYHFPMPQQTRKNRRISRCRARHAISSGHQGEPEGNAADRGQAAHSVCSGRGAVCRRRHPGVHHRQLQAGHRGSFRHAIRNSRPCCRRRASRNCWIRCAASCRAGPPASTFASRRRSGWVTRCCARGRWSAMRPSWCISRTT